VRDAPLPRPPLPPAVVRVREAAVRLGVSPAVVRRWIQTGVLAGVRIPAGHYRVRVSSLQMLEPQPSAGAVDPPAGIRTDRPRAQDRPS